MKKLNSAILISVSIYIVSSCDPVASRECQGFNYDFNGWFSYETADSIKYKSNTGETILFQKISSYKSEPYIGTQRGTKKSSWVDCHMSGIYNFANLEGSQIMTFKIDQTEYGEYSSIRDEVFIRYEIRDTTEIPLPEHILNILPGSLNNPRLDTITEISINNIQYNTVITSTNDTTFLEMNSMNDFDIYKIYIARNAGIVKMISRNNTEWNLEK